MPEENWARTHAFAAPIHRPGSIDELAELVAGVPRIRALGSRHSFTDIADAEALVDLAGVPERFEVAGDRATVTVSGNVTYGRLAELLAAEGLAIHNTASLPHITVAGAIATATHGSGDRNGNLATAVAGLELVTAAGDRLTAHRGDPDFDGMVVSLGALGIVTAVTLDVRPSFDMKQSVLEDLSWDTLADGFDRLFGAGYSVSAFIRPGPTVEQLWVKQLADDPDPDPAALGGTPAPVDRHPIAELAADGCTSQCGAVGLWSARLPHFRPHAIPASGEEIQSEYFVDRRHGGPAVGAIRAATDRLGPNLLVGEIRTVAADRLWLSPQYDRHSVAFHFSWVHDPARAAEAAHVVEEALAPFDPRPHWGKLYTEARFSAAAYERSGDFAALRDRLDPDRKLANRWLEQALRPT